MKFDYADTFTECFRKLPKPTQKLIEEKLRLLEQNPNHPSFRLKRLQGFKREDIWEGHFSIRVVFTFTWTYEGSEKIMLFLKVGGHDIYNNPF